MTQTMGAVLTGGRSSRFGSDKGAALLGGITLADHAAAAIAPFVATVIQVGGTDGIADVPVPGLGPLGGIAGALNHARAQGFDRVLTIGCDMPRVPDGLIAMLMRHAPAYCVEAPVLGHWPADRLAALLALLCVPVQAGTRTGHPPSGVNETVKTGPSIRAWANSMNAIPIAAMQPLANINTPEDLRTL